MQKIKIMTVIFLLSVLSACSIGNNTIKKRVQIKTEETEQQQTTFMRGTVMLSSQKRKLELSVLDYSYNEMVIAISVANESEENFVFSGENVEVLQQRLGNIYPAKIYDYEELLVNAANDANYATLSDFGSKALSVGTSFIPFGDVVVSLGNALLSMAEQGVSHQERINSLVTAQLNQMYLRQHTLKPTSDYGGILKIQFPAELIKGDRVTFNIAIGDEIESFNFICS